MSVCVHYKTVHEIHPLRDPPEKQKVKRDDSERVSNQAKIAR